jgi:hypothetical protein
MPLTEPVEDETDADAPEPPRELQPVSASQAAPQRTTPPSLRVISVIAVTLPGR